jgi:hypothetical protein
LHDRLANANQLDDFIKGVNQKNYIIKPVTDDIYKVNLLNGRVNKRRESLD